MKILYCDVDSTLNNRWVRIQKWAVPSFPGKEIHQNAFTREEIMKDLPLPHSVETLKEFSKEYEIHILSARGFEDSYQITKDWLDKYGYPYDSINIVKYSKEKVDILKHVDVDLFIDDLSKGQEYGESYEVLYTDVIEDLKQNNINLEIFKNNWLEIKQKYLGE